MLVSRCSAEHTTGGRVATGCPVQPETGTGDILASFQGMVWIPGGSFKMGSADPLARPDEGPVHAVRVPGWVALRIRGCHIRVFDVYGPRRRLIQRVTDESSLAVLSAISSCASDSMALVSTSIDC